MVLGVPGPLSPQFEQHVFPTTGQLSDFPQADVPQRAVRQENPTGCRLKPVVANPAEVSPGPDCRTWGTAKSRR